MLLILSTVLAGCGGYAPRVTSTASPTYQTDLVSCQDTSAAEVNRRNAKTGLAWFSSPFRRTFQIHAAIRGCMEAKGYTLA